MTQKEYEAYKKMYDGFKQAMVNYAKLSPSTKLLVNFSGVMAGRLSLAECDKNEELSFIPEFILDLTNSLYTLQDELKK